MRKLLNKKGFTLVELMIVVVILGILVAVAVPIFSAVTKNARKKSCKANMRVIKGNIETYQSTGNNGEEVVFAADTVLSSTTPAEFMKLFDNNALPTCPTNNAPYTVTVKVLANGLAYEILCTSSEASEHNA
ncbi:MAG: type II secretion system protein [Clostridia bacterium]|nr:type II secretion system protein [Clostridia bacterium]